jgi:hypothetical protein
MICFKKLICFIQYKNENTIEFEGTKNDHEHIFSSHGP